MSQFTPLEPYDIDPEDRMTVGRLSVAARLGDERARLTLRQISKQRAAERAADDAARAAERQQQGRTIAAAKERALQRIYEAGRNQSESQKR